MSKAPKAAAIDEIERTITTPPKSPVAGIADFARKIFARAPVVASIRTRCCRVSQERVSSDDRPDRADHDAPRLCVGAFGLLNSRAGEARVYDRGRARSGP